MRINKKQITTALGVDSDDLSSKDLTIALKNIETIIDDIAIEIEDDFQSAALGDASNLIQMIRNGL